MRAVACVSVVTLSKSSAERHMMLCSNHKGQRQITCLTPDATSRQRICTPRIDPESILPPILNPDSFRGPIEQDRQRSRAVDIIEMREVGCRCAADLSVEGGGGGLRVEGRESLKPLRPSRVEVQDLQV